MCDYDYSYTELRSRDVITRKAHECASCHRRYPPGTKMNYAIGIQDGDFCDGYACRACLFGFRQPEHGDLHLCWGWAWDGADDDVDYLAAYDYIRSCFDRGTEPTIFGVMAERSARLLAITEDDA